MSKKPDEPFGISTFFLATCWDLWSRNFQTVTAPVNYHLEKPLHFAGTGNRTFDLWLRSWALIPLDHSLQLLLLAGVLPVAADVEQARRSHRQETAARGEASKTRRKKKPEAGHEARTRSCDSRNDRWGEALTLKVWVIWIVTRFRSSIATLASLYTIPELMTAKYPIAFQCYFCSSSQCYTL